MNIPLAYDVVPTSDSVASSPTTATVNGTHAHSQPQQQQYEQYNSTAMRSFTNNGNGYSHSVMTLPPSGYSNGSSTTVAVHVGADTSGYDAPLLPSAQEQAWRQEMEIEGIGHLPTNWYRQTPHQAVWSAYGVINRIISMLVNFGASTAAATATAGRARVQQREMHACGKQPMRCCRCRFQ